MRTVVIAGASGLVGAHCLQELLAHPDVARVISVGRRPLDTPRHDRLEHRVVDFANRDLVEQIPKDIEDAYCALGTTMRKAGSREAFIAVDKFAVLAFARACRERGARRFLLVSALGADPRSMNFYYRVKGEADDALRSVGFDVVHILRPSFLDGERKDRRPLERIGIGLARAVSHVFPSATPIAAHTVARAMVHLAFTDLRGHLIHDSPALSRIGT